MTPAEPPFSESQAFQPRVEKLREGPWLQIRYPWDFEFNRVTLPIAGLPSALTGLRILHLTDLHFRAGWAAPFDELIERVAADPPDLILFTGDLVEYHYDPRPAFASAGRLVTALKSHHGKFAILGNHDGDLLGAMLQSWGLTLINGGMLRLHIHGGMVELIGLAGVHREDLTDALIDSIPHRSTQQSPPQSPQQPRSDRVHWDGTRIVMSHYPDAIRRIGSLNADVVLAGHTHGGQICLPGGIPLLTHDTLPRRMGSGIHRVDDTWLVVGRGFGFSTWPFRTFCPAEVIELKLISADATTDAGTTIERPPRSSNLQSL